MSRSKLRTPADAVAEISSGAVVAVGGSGHLLQVPDGLLAALAERHAREGAPERLTIVHTMGLGDNETRGLERLSAPGLVRKFIGSHYGHDPKVMAAIADERVQAFGVPAGVLSMLYREIAGGRPGLLTRVGLGTYLDPRIEGGRLNRRTEGSIAELMTLDGEEWLLYRSFPIEVGLIRATTADPAGNLTMEDEAGFGDNLALASAVKNSGGIVIAEVKRLAAAGSLAPKEVRVPGILVDLIVVVPEQRQTAATEYSPFLAGRLRSAHRDFPALPVGPRRSIARRAADELARGDVVNLGFGIATGVATVLAEEGCYDRVVLTVEQGIIGGVPASGLDSGTAVNPEAIIDETAQFDLYDGGILDVCCVSFGEVDRRGDVNVGKLAGRPVGPGGFVNITQNARKVVFCGTLTGGGLDVAVSPTGPVVRREGSYPKFVDAVEQVTFSAARARAAGHEVLYVTERAVFVLTDAGLELREIAPRIDIERDVIARMGFRPSVSDRLTTMDARLYREPVMGLPRLG